jgi:16S rRNA processing protein RimM
VQLEGEDASRGIERVETSGRGLVLHLAGIGTREAAEAVTGRYIEAQPQELEPDAYFWEDLIGLRVEDASGAEVGELVEIFRAGGNEVYRVVGPAGERLVPALRSAVREIDLARGLMVVEDDDAEEVR